MILLFAILISVFKSENLKVDVNDNKLLINNKSYVYYNSKHKKKHNANKKYVNLIVLKQFS